MASQHGGFSPFDKSQRFYYEKVPHDEDTSHQISEVEDISIGLAEDLSFLIAGTKPGVAQHGTADIKILSTRDDIYYKIYGDRYPWHGTGYVELRQSYEFLQFKFNVSNGQATYLIACSEDTYGQYVAPMNEQEFSLDGRTHPFAVHLVLLAKTINAQGMENDKTLRRLMMLEEKCLRGSSEITFDDPNETKHQLQVLHGLLLHLVMSTNKNSRHLSFFKNLMRDLERVRKFPKSIKGAFVIDSYSHERLVNGFRSLEGYCQNRGRRLASRQQRVQNLVNLTYNLLANRDSKVNSDIARESAVIAYGTRKDGASMMTIAGLGMVFLPSTFVSTLLGSNLFALEDNGAGKHSFVVSDQWWIYLAIALPLTLITMGIWGLCLKFRTKWIKKGRLKEAQDMV